MKRYILVCDYGLDDAAATVELFCRKAKEDRVDILPVGGNMPLEQTAKNARILLSHLGERARGVRLVDSSCLPQREERLTPIHGADGMGDCLEERPLTGVETLSLSRWEESLTGEEILISLGPLTVPAYLLKKHRFSRVLIMGGNVAEEPNFRGREFNHALDTAAFSACVSYPHEVATLDTCRHPFFNLVKSFPPTEDPLLKRLLERSLHYAALRQWDRWFVYDWVLIYALFHPEAFAVQERVDPDGNRLNVLEYLG